MVQTKKTHNSYLADKAALRIAHLPTGKVSVLDCFGGMGLVWRAVAEKSGRDISVLSIDTVDYGGYYLPGDNMAYLNSMDLSKYNVIDLDSYGVPYAQLKTVIGRAYMGHVFVTMTQALFGALPGGLLRDLGFTQKMINKSPALLYKRGWQYFCEWLALHGVGEISHRSHDRKHYLYFELK